MDERATATAVEAVEMDIDGIGDAMPMKASNTGGSTDSPIAAAGGSGVDKENNEPHMAGSRSRDSGLDDMNVDGKPQAAAVMDRTTSDSDVAAEPTTTPEDGSGKVTEPQMRRWLADLFPDGTGEPSYPPDLVAVVEKPTYELCKLALKLFDDSPRVHGKLDGYEVIGYLVAYAIGIELLPEEALKVGASARGYALKAKAEESSIEGRARSKKSKLRGKAVKDADRAARLDEDCRQVDAAAASECAAFCSRSDFTINAMPAAKTKIVKSRAPKQAPEPEPEEPEPEEPDPVEELEAELTELQAKLEVAEVMADAANNKGQRAIKHLQKIPPPGGVTSEKGLDGYWLQRWLRGETDRKYNYGIDFPDSVRDKRLAAKERFFSAKARVAEVMEEARDAAFAVRDTQNLIDLCETKLEKARIEKELAANEQLVEILRMRLELSRLEAPEREATREMLQADSVHVWGGPEAPGVTPGEGRAGPKVFKLTGKSASEVAGMSAEVSQVTTGAAERVALNKWARDRKPVVPEGVPIVASTATGVVQGVLV